ncbi:GNAT family N-acetyltransferase [Ferrimonas sediminicola]|uniref:Protein ElaA n=1 Tax=Ferrimonas sediminicola TaxID=2569538 RepID=A0A4U1BH27_9GAMM|nr:GNAT family N-acetyltransferase [Ferrimonas sediminicola]TKB50662.1 GNAT family N-acetyltransferase [Ferrimonas sediminicola]
MLTWQLLTFDQLTTHTLYDLIKLRIEIFVVEQTCPYPELDDKDRAPGAHHLLGYNGDTLVACARLLPPGVSFEGVSIGRVAIDAGWRGGQRGHQLMEQALSACELLWPGQVIEIGAQEHLQGFYRRHGFQAVSDSYLEDGIPHVDMRRVPG